VGRLCPSKGLETLLRSIALLAPRWPELKVFVLGDEVGGRRYRQQLERLAVNLGLADTVLFFGYVDDAASLSAEFDVQVICSTAEPFGLVTLEAMAQSRPVVATATGGSPELVRDGVEGFLVRPDDADTLARRLDCLLDSPGLRREMGQRGRRRVYENFTRRNMLDRTEELYREIMA
jgi:glycosyltransferase involved in cell wall biosynthesis